MRAPESLDAAKKTLFFPAFCASLALRALHALAFGPPRRRRPQIDAAREAHVFSCPLSLQIVNRFEEEKFVNMRETQ
jgi:hypothetical protein